MTTVDVRGDADASAHVAGVCAGARSKLLKGQYGCGNYDLCNHAVCSVCWLKMGGKTVDVIELE